MGLATILPSRACCCISCRVVPQYVLVRDRHQEVNVNNLEAWQKAHHDLLTLQVRAARSTFWKPRGDGPPCPARV